MKGTEPLQRRVLARKKCTPLQVVAVTLEMAMTFVMVTLLIVIMLVEGITPHHSGFPTDLAKARHVVAMPNAKREDAIRIAVTRDGGIYFGHIETRVADLPDQIRQKVRDGSERRAYLRVDARTQYGDVKTVLDAIRGGGIWSIGLVVEQDQSVATER